MTTALYAYSLVPVVAISLLLFFTVALRQKSSRGLAAYCLATAVWSSQLLISLSDTPLLSELGVRLAASGAFVVAGYLHAAYDLTAQKNYGLVIFAYVVAAVITGLGAFTPGLLYDPANLSAGPLFWHTMVLAVVAAAVPMILLVLAARRADTNDARHLRRLLWAGVMGYLGAWSNAVMLAYGWMQPYGLFLVLGSLLLLAVLVQSLDSRADRRLFERSLIYSGLAAFLSAGFLFGALVVLSDTTGAEIRDYGLGALFLLVMAALAFEPVRQHLQESLGRALSGDRAQAPELARALVSQEEKAEQARQLAELGAFTSAIAHEVRNPLGVISGYLSLLERGGADEEILDEIRAQIDRAGGFLDELLSYGRPRPLELRRVTVKDTAELALSSVQTARSELATPVTWEVDVPPDLWLEADQAQLLQVLVILLDNALLALSDQDGPDPKIRIYSDHETGGDVVEIHVEDTGPGIPEALRDRLFEPFVTGRKREGEGQGTGLGLAIARGILERHGGELRCESAPGQGATFSLRLPRVQRILAAAQAIGHTEEVPS